MATSQYTSKDIKRFWSKVDTSRGMFACWLWTDGCNRDGYGKFGWRGKWRFAHRIMWELMRGDIGKQRVLHQCDNPRCCNPSHLFLGTQQDNIRDMINKGRSNRVKGERSPFHKLTEQQVREIRQRYIPHIVSLRRLAREYSVSDMTISGIVNRSKWKAVE